MINLKAEQEQREAEEAVEKENADYTRQHSKGWRRSEGSDWDELYRDGYRDSAVRRELKLRAYERAVEEIRAWEAKNESNDPQSRMYNFADGLKTAREIIRKHLESIP